MERFVLGRYAQAQAYEEAIENISLMDYCNILNPNYEIYEPKVRIIYQKLAIALEQNAVNKIKILKKEFEGDKDFAKAKQLLNDKCKQVWNVYDKKKKNIPYEGMKCLGITNQPSLEFLLSDSIKFFEKDGGITTSEIISRTLKTTSYSIKDIHAYLILMHKKGYHYNNKTIKYLICEQNYDFDKLKEIGVQNNNLKTILKTFSLTNRISFLFKNLKIQMQKNFCSGLIR